MRIAVGLVLLALMSPAATAQQESAAQAITLSGVVVTDNDVPLARVRVAAMDSPEAAGFTDARGQFTLRVPDTESVRLTFTKARYETLTTAMRRSAALRADGLRVRLSLGAAISGYVRDRSGEPVLQAEVTARRLGQALSSALPAVSVTTTDDLGEFRFGGLAAGAFAIAVRRVQSGAERNIPEKFEEQTVNVSRGAEVGIDFRIDMPSELDRYPQGYRNQPGPEATASLRGRVTTARGVPIAGVLVQVRGSGGLTQVESDSRGRYLFDRLAPGEYLIEAIKRGFSPVTPGQGQNAVEILLRNALPQDRSILVRAGETTPVDLTLGRGASVAGTIMDEFGEPMQRITVNALQLRVMGGVTRAIPVSSARGGSAQTDDRGRYRLFGLQPGTYVIRAMTDAPVSAATGYVPVFYPGTPIIDAATPAALEADASASGIDFTLLPSPTRRVHGTVVDPAGKPVRVDVTLTVRARPGGIQAEPVHAITNVDGTFAFTNVAPGEYVVQAMATGKSDPDARALESRQYVSAVVTVTDDDSTPLPLKLSAGATLVGHVVYEGITSSPPLYTGVSLMTVSVDSDRDRLLDAYSPGFVLSSDDTFEYRGIFGRNYLTARVPNANWYVKSITYRGEDLTDSAFDFGSTATFRDIEVVVSGAGAVVSGRAFDERAAPVRDYTVALFPIDRSKWTLLSRWLKTRRASPDGTFRLTGLVPGDYWVVAVDRLDGSDVAGDLQSPEILEALATRAARITLAEGQAQDLALGLIRR